MYYGLRKAFPGVKVISEEHTEAPDLSDVPLPKTDDEEVSNSMIGDETVKADDVSIWIDPLDVRTKFIFFCPQMLV
jgi:3'-phosphoadenosine 5'-phosphosulfate (PAPS) 3'-phosphatase